MWFSGDHSDIGGNWAYDNDGTKISVMPLRWILSFAIEYGGLFKKDAVLKFNIMFPPLQSCFAFQHDTLSFKSYKYPGYTSPHC